MSLTDPTKKMSKSDPRPKSRILITDSREQIHNKLKTALTDSIEGVSYDRENRPGVSNLIDMLYHFDESAAAATPQQLADDLRDLSMRALKEKVADTIDTGIREIRGRYDELIGGDERKLIEHAGEGARRAETMAETTMLNVRSAMGLRW
jgi:tryptophanyl-tRNA synthetase